MFHTMIVVLLINKYIHQILNFKIAWIFKIISWIMIPLEFYLIIATRQHYTVDLVVAIYTSILLYLVYDVYIPKDYKPKVEYERMEPHKFEFIL